MWYHSGMPMLSGRLRTAVAVSVASFCTIGLAPIASAADERGLSTLEISSYARDAKVSEGEAAARLGRQRALPALAAAARKNLGDAFGGLWVDNGDGDRIKLGVVGFDGGRSAAAQHARDALSAVGLTDGAETVAYPRSERDLQSDQRALDAALESANKGTATTIDVEVDVPNGRLRLLVPPDGVILTGAQQEFLATAQERVKSAVVVQKQSGVGRLRACSSAAWCDPPLRGGVRIVYSGTGYCSSGFVAKSKSDGVPYLMTAAHCFEGGKTGTWSTHFADGSSHDIGALHNRVAPPTGDAGILRINNPSGWGLPARRIRIQSDPDYIITARAGAVVGQRICATASYTDSNCGTVTGGLATRIGVQNTFRANFCGTGGDSGGSVFSDHTAYGLESGGYSACDSTFYDMGFATLWLNVDPAL